MVNFKSVPSSTNLKKGKVSNYGSKKHSKKTSIEKQVAVASRKRENVSEGEGVGHLLEYEMNETSKGSTTTKYTPSELL